MHLKSQLPDEKVADLPEDVYNSTGVMAWYRDAKMGQQKKLTEGDQTKPKRLMHLYASKTSAKRALVDEWGKISCSLNIRYIPVSKSDFSQP